jgi:Aminoglycoside-2''-adenylyltransferase
VTPDLDVWRPWHPRDVAQILAGTKVPWAVAAGWAIDLHLGRQTRSHGDVEVAIPRADFPLFRRALTAFDLYEADQVVRLLGPDESPVAHQVWVFEREIGHWRMDTFLEPGDRETWVSHRDETLTLPLAEVIRLTPEGIPYLAPATVLLAKAKHDRDKDQADLANTLPTLSAAERSWLAAAIAHAHPGHRWLPEIGG